jgi:cytochrome b561
VTATAADLHESRVERYSRGAIAFHWAIAALIIVNLFLGFFHDSWGRDAAKQIMFVHKASGMTILALSVARLVWRLTHRPPAFDAALQRWEATLARVTHWFFYVLMIAIPISGWILSSTSNRTTDFWGLFDIGVLPVSQSEETHELWEEVHELAGWAMLILLALHVGGALKHHFQGHKHLIGRMSPRRPR